MHSKYIEMFLYFPDTLYNNIATVVSFRYKMFLFCACLYMDWVPDICVAQRVELYITDIYKSTFNNTSEITGTFIAF